MKLFIVVLAALVCASAKPSPQRGFDFGVQNRIPNNWQGQLQERFNIDPQGLAHLRPNFGAENLSFQQFQDGFIPNNWQGQLQERLNSLNTDPQQFMEVAQKHANLLQENDNGDIAKQGLAHLRPNFGADNLKEYHQKLQNALAQVSDKDINQFQSILGGHRSRWAQ